MQNATAHATKKRRRLVLPCLAQTGAAALLALGLFQPAAAAAPSTRWSAAVVGPQPRAAGQIGVVDTTNRVGNAATYLGPTYTVPSGGDTFGGLYDAFDQTGTVTHSSGTLNLDNYLELADGTNSNGTYNLSGTGTINTPETAVGFNGTGVFNQSGGTHNVGSTGLYIGFAITSANGTYTLSGGTLSVTGGTHLGTNGTGVFTQSGGTATLGGLYFVGGASTAKGTVNLNSGGTLNVLNIDLGGTSGGTSTFNFNGGTLRPTNSIGTTFFPNVLTTANVRNGGAIFNTAGFNVTVGQPLIHSTVGGDNATDGGLTKSGTGTLTLGGANTYTGPTAVNAGTLQAGVASVAGTSGAFGRNSAVTLANVAGATLDLNGFNTQVGSLTGGGTAGGNVTLGAATLSVGADNTSPAAFAGTVSGTGGLTKLGTGTLTLTGANTYTGATTVSAGTLQLGSGGTTGSLSSGSAITDNGSLVFNRSNAVAQGTDFGGAAITGTGSLTQAGTGTLTLTAANTYTGTTTVSAGTLLANNTTGSATGTGAVTVQSGGTLGGTGAVAGAVTVQSGGRLNAGNAGATGLLTLASNLSLTPARPWASNSAALPRAPGTTRSGWPARSRSGAP